ncbi:MAG: orotidine-5'-phosphate decarboxylase [Bacillota bacterium]
MEPAEKRLLIALDYPDPVQAKNMVAELAPLGVGFKVGLELYMAGGPEFVKELALKHRIFLDLKFHDIPNTVAGAVKQAASLGVWMVNVHASGGRAMLKAALQALSGSGNNRPLLFAVTVLTSLNEQDLAETGCLVDLDEKVQKLTNLALECGFDGVVCSPLEVASIKRNIPGSFLTVTPGVRPAGTDRKDQFRTATPGEIIRSGGDYLVVGRPVTRAEDPASAVRNIIQEMGLGDE